MILLDTSGLLAAYDLADPSHDEAIRLLRAARPPRILSPYVLAELDYLVSRRVGSAAQEALIDEVASGAYRLAHLSSEDVAVARDVMRGHRDLGVGLTDASIVVLSHRYGAQDILTLDQRHFRVLQGPRGPFRILPADA